MFKTKKPKIRARIKHVEREKVPRSNGSNEKYPFALTKQRSPRVDARCLNNMNQLARSKGVCYVWYDSFWP